MMSYNCDARTYPLQYSFILSRIYVLEGVQTIYVHCSPTLSIPIAKRPHAQNFTLSTTTDG